MIIKKHYSVLPSYVGDEVDSDPLRTAFFSVPKFQGFAAFYSICTNEYSS